MKLAFTNSSGFAAFRILISFSYWFDQYCQLLGSGLINCKNQESWLVVLRKDTIIIVIFTYIVSVYGIIINSCMIILNFNT